MTLQRSGEPASGRILQSQRRSDRRVPAAHTHADRMPWCLCETRSRHRRNRIERG